MWRIKTTKDGVWLGSWILHSATQFHPFSTLPWDDQYPLHHWAIDQSLSRGENSPQNRPQFGLKRLNRQNIFGFERPRGRRDTLYCSPFFDSISHPIGQDPMILCINAQAASSGDLAKASDEGYFKNLISGGRKHSCECSALPSSGGRKHSCECKRPLGCHTRPPNSTLSLPFPGMTNSLYTISGH